MSNNYPIRGHDQVVEGIYHLGAVVHESPVCSICETEFGPERLPAVIRIRPLEAPDAEWAFARWESAAELHHPNLLTVFATGQSLVNGSPVCYAVTERAEETLATVLAQRTLSEAETREMLTPLLEALSYLHQNGYAHSNLKPSNVLAVNDVVKISSEDVTAVRDGGRPADDIRALGELIVQTTDPYGSEVFRDIVRNCLSSDAQRRWSVEEVQARLNGEVLYPAVPRVRRKVPVWIYGGLTAIVLIVLLIAFMRSAGEKDPVPGAAAPVVAESTGGPASSPAPEAVPVPPVRAVPVPKAKEAAARKADGWSVIVAAYTSPEPAEKRRREMARRWPRFTLSVVKQQASRTWYLIVLGDNLSEDAADALRTRAISAGLPSDSYVKRLR